MLNVQCHLDTGSADYDVENRVATFSGCLDFGSDHLVANFCVLADEQNNTKTGFYWIDPNAIDEDGNSYELSDSQCAYIENEVSKITTAYEDLQSVREQLLEKIAQD